MLRYMLHTVPLITGLSNAEQAASSVAVQW
jgi:hypothetical protein